MEKSYRIHTNISSDTVLNVNMKQDFEFLEVLSLKLAQKDAYKIHSSNYGVIVGRVLANDAFGIPNAKISVFIERDDNDTTEVENIYPYTQVTSKDRNSIRYNLLPDYSDDECYRIVGTFPNKRLMLDDDTYLEVYDKYWKYTTVTNNAGDYMLFGVPTGSLQVHVDIDLSDIGILSQKPRDFIYKGYNMTEFDNANQFKASTNLDNLRQIISQNKSVFVYPFWGDADNGIAAITRADIQVDYKFEPTCIFMGSIVSDNDANAIGHKCAPSVKNGMNNQLVAGEGTIEMIRKTVDGLVEEFQIQGNRLIDSDGVWCYQIPMNLDYIGTDEYGNIVPTDNPNKGIPTRTQVRFRFSKTETGDEGFSRHTAKYLVPMNPLIREGEKDFVPRSQVSGAEFEKLYNFGSDTPQSCFRDLYWNNVYSVKNYVPKVQVAHRPYSANYGALKGANITDNQNPIPFNKMRIDIPFMYMIVCILFTIVMVILTFINAVLICPLNAIIQLVNNVFGLLKKPWPIKYLFKWIPDIPYIACIPLSAGLTEGNVVYLPGCFCGRGKDAYKCDADMPNCRKSDNNSELKDKIQQNLALQYEVVKLDLHQDWVNGCLYMPLWYWRKRKKSTFLFGLFTRSAKNEFCDCDKKYSRLKTYVTCDIPYEDASLTIGNDVVNNGATKWHKKESAQVRYQNGLIKGVKNKDGLTVYYYVAMQPTDDEDDDLIINRPEGFRAIRLYATDIILLGNLNKDNLYGIPQFFKVLPSTTANIPPIASVEESLSEDSAEVPEYDASDSEDSGTSITTGMDWGYRGDKETPAYRTGLFLDLACTYAETRLKSCINVERLSELGVNLDMTYNMSYSNGGNNIQTGLIESDGFITKYELDDMNNRSMFATLNHIGFIPQTYLDEIGAKYTTQVEDENTTYLVPKFKFIFPTDFDGRMQGPMDSYKGGFEQAMYDEQDEAYLTFRLGAERFDDNLGQYHGRVRHFYKQSGRYFNMPLYNNSFYFYFGINKGNTAIDKFNNMFLAECVQNSKEPFSLDVNGRPKSFCPTAYNNEQDAYAIIKVTSDDIQAPYSYVLYDSVGNVVVGENNMTATTFTIGDVEDGGKVKYQIPIDDDDNPDTPKVYEAVENDYGVSGLTNQVYNLVVTDDNGKKVSRRIELDMQGMALNYASYRLGTRFYNTATSRKDYICSEEDDYYGRIQIDEISIDGMNCTVEDIEPLTVTDDEYTFKVKVKNDKLKAETYVMLHFRTLESSYVGEIQDCLCGGRTTPRVTYMEDKDPETHEVLRKYIQFDVYQPKRYVITLKQICDDKELDDNQVSEIVRVFNGENFNTFLNDMPTRFMLGTNSDSPNADVASTSKFYNREVITNPTDSHICGWFGVHQEDSYQFSRSDTTAVLRNQVVWEDFIDFGEANITAPSAKLSIIDYKFEKMFSLSDGVYVTGDLNFRAVGGVQPTMYRSVVPAYGEASKTSSVYNFDDLNMTSVTKRFPNIVGNNYSGHTDENRPVFNRYYDNENVVGNYFAAFTNNGGYKNRKELDRTMSVMRSPSFASVSPYNDIPKEIGKVIQNSITRFGLVHTKGTQTLQNDKRRTTLPYLRALTVDRRLDYDLTFLGPVIGSTFSLYENAIQGTSDKDRPWKGARIFGNIYGGIEMSYDSDYNIVSAQTPVTDSEGNLISVSPNTLLEYSYTIPQGDVDAKTIYNKPVNVFWERDLATEGFTPPANTTMNKRFYEASLGGVDVRDYLWSTFNKTRLSRFINDPLPKGQGGSGLEKLRSTPLPYVFSYPSTQTNLYNGDFNREDVIKPNNYPTKRFIDVCNILPLGSYNFRITSCSYGGMQTIINEDNTIYAETREGETFDLDFDFERPVQFMQPSSDNKNLGNIEYTATRGTVANGYTKFTASAANIMFTIAKKSANDFDIYTRLPRLVRVLPYTNDIDGLTYFKTTTPNGEINARKSLDSAINNVVFYNFQGRPTIKVFIFHIEGDVYLPEGVYYTEGLRDNYDREIWGDFLYKESDESFVTSDSNEFGNVTFIKSLDANVFRSVKVFSVLVDRVYVSNSDNMLINNIRTVETSELIDARDVLLKFDPENSYVELRNLETEVKVEVEVPVVEGVNVEVDDEGSATGEAVTSDEPVEGDGSGTSKSYSQTVAFKLRLNLTGDPAFNVSNQVFVDYSNMSFSFMFTKGEDEYFVDCGDTKLLNEETFQTDGFMELLLKMKWTQEMGTMYDQDSGTSRWGCYMLAKTASSFSYKIGNFVLQAAPQEMPTEVGTPIRTQAQIVN